MGDGASFKMRLVTLVSMLVFVVLVFIPLMVVADMTKESELVVKDKYTSVDEKVIHTLLHTKDLEIINYINTNSPLNEVRSGLTIILAIALAITVTHTVVLAFYVRKYRRTADNFSRQSKFQQILTEISTELIGSDVTQEEENLNYVAKELCMFFGMDKSRIAVSSEDQSICSRNIEIYRAGFSKALSFSDDRYPDIFRDESKVDIICSQDVVKMEDEAISLSKVLLSKDIKSFVSLAIRSGNRKIGFITLMSATIDYKWTKDEVNGLKVLAGMVGDLIIRNQKETALQKAYVDVKAADEAKSNFLSVMSHELRTPLNAVIGYSEVLNMTLLSDEQEEYVDLIKTSGDNLLGIVSSILSYTELEADTYIVNTSRTDLSGFFEDIINSHQDRAQLKGLRVRLIRDGNLPKFGWIDTSLLTKTLDVLLDNSIKFSKHGSIDLRVFYRSTSLNHGKLLISVKDSGKGIDESFMDNLFKPFFQEEQNHNRSYGGTGIGLAIASKAVKEMGGTLDCISEIDKGSEFFFEIMIRVH